MKSIFIDTETTGLDPKKHGLIQLAGFIEINNELVETFNYTCRPFPNDMIEDQALAVNKLTKDQIMSFDAPYTIFKEFEHLLGRYVNKFEASDKFHFYAYNAPFDADFLRAWFIKNESKYFGSWFFHPSLDIMTRAAFTLRERRPRLPNFKLATVATHLGIELEESELHDALYEIKLAKQVLIACENLERSFMQS